MRLAMDRFTTLQKAGAAIIVATFLGVLLNRFFVELVDVKYRDYALIVVVIVLSLGLYLIFEKNIFTKVVFDKDRDVVTYYRFFLFKKELSLSSVTGIAGQTKTERIYSRNKSKTVYITDVFIYTACGDYQIRVFERTKLNEFKNKFSEVKRLC